MTSPVPLQARQVVDATDFAKELNPEQLAVATAPGKFTRFRIVLPALAARQDAVA